MENKEQTVLFMNVYTPLTAHFFSNDARQEDREVTEEEYGRLLDGEDLAQYEASIRERILQENGVDEKNSISCNLMEYFHGSDSIKEKVSHAVVSVKSIEGVLYGCTTLTLQAYLEAPELKELCEYITGQYADGWGEGFEQRDIYVDGGYLNVHFYQPKSSQVQEYETKMVEKSTAREQKPKIKLLGHDGNIFSIMGDARKLLLQNGQGKEAEEMCERIHKSHDYYKALSIVSEYVETELSHERSGTAKGSKDSKKKEDCR